MEPQRQPQVESFYFWATQMSLYNVAADTYVPSNMGLIYKSTCLETHIFSPKPNCHRLCHNHHMIVSTNCASSGRTYPSRLNQRRRMNDWASDDCWHRGERQNWAVRWVLEHCYDAWNVRKWRIAVKNYVLKLSFQVDCILNWWRDLC